MPDYRAEVTPDQPWGEDGTARTDPLPPSPIAGERTLPLENRSPQETTVARSDYPKGLVVIKEGDPPSGSSAELTMRVSDGDSITVLEDEIRSWPNGFVAWFTG